ncbi:cation:proton antiporter [Haloterrigena sp. SYSU A558-1]|uniref:Cation:proton antiporter n=1 Tax=Haloterrigena gelatinilytica TaxID=2741724 RepID=A0ABX2LJK7_9EURY|nr:cation:proton antiporter [Haloterrigena gelatinilytica]NUC74031.1 cation:proton antiporter [Haloterrigena gelatinilytica]
MQSAWSAAPSVVAVAIPDLPLEEPVLVFTLALAIFLVGPLLVRRLGQPGIVGIVLFGALLGPGGTGLIAHSDAIVLLGEVGLIYLLFTVGLELDLRQFAEDPGSAALFGLVSFGLPFVVGTAAVIVLLDLSLLAGLLLAAVFASHTLLAYPIVNQYDITGNRAVTAVFGGILFTDTLALFVLALVRSAAETGLTAGVVVGKVLALVALLAGVWVVVPPIARRFLQNFSEESYFEFLFVAVVFFGAASVATLLDVAPILGAFVAGLALNRLIPEGGTLLSRIEFAGNAFFVPFFLLHVGMLVDATVIFQGRRTLEVAAVIVGVMVALKWAAAWLVARVKGYTADERDVMFGLSIGQAAAALAITLIGYDVGLFDAAILNAVVLMLLVTAVASPWLTKRAGQRLALADDVEPGDDAPADPRILLPISHAADRQRHLLELALLLKDDEREEPIHTLTVVRPDRSGDPDRAVDEAYTDLEELTAAGSEAEVPVAPEIRVDHNPASGIVRGAVEVQADLLLLGWDAQRSLGQRLFGSVIDQVLDRTTDPVVVARLGHPVNTTDRLFVVLPEGIDHHEGFFESVALLKRLADRLGAPLTVLAVGGSAHQYERLFDLVEPELDAEFRDLNSWRALHSTLEDEATANDLVSVISSRPGSVGWHDQLRELPYRLAALPPESFVLLHPREDDPEYDRQFLRFK